MAGALLRKALAVMCISGKCGVVLAGNPEEESCGTMPGCADVDSASMLQAHRAVHHGAKTTSTSDVHLWDGMLSGGGSAQDPECVEKTQWSDDERFQADLLYAFQTRGLTELTVTGRDVVKGMQSALQYLCPDFALTVHNTGTYKPADYALEYFALSNIAVNKALGFWREGSVDNSSIRSCGGNRKTFKFQMYPYFLLDWMRVPGVSWTVDMKFDKFPAGSGLGSQFGGWCIKESYNHVPLVFGAFFRYGPVLGMVPESATACRTLEGACDGGPCLTGDCSQTKKYPFESSESCIAEYDKMPFSCADPGSPLRGNSRTCRSLHQFLTDLIPETHCWHTGLESDQKCIDAECPSSVYYYDGFGIVRGKCKTRKDHTMDCKWDWNPFSMAYNLMLLLTGQAFV